MLWTVIYWIYLHWTYSYLVFSSWLRGKKKLDCYNCYRDINNFINWNSKLISWLKHYCRLLIAPTILSTFKIGIEPQSFIMMVQCAGCDRPILDRFLLNVLDRAWHTACVKCSDCKNNLTEKCFFRDGKLYCRTDFFRWVFESLIKLCLNLSIFF